MANLDFNKLCELYQVPSFIKDSQLSQIEFVKVFKIGIYTIDDYLMVIRGRIEYDCYRKLMIVPCFPRYAVDFSGNVFDTKTNRYLPQQSRDYKYVEIFVPSRNEFRTLGVHRLVALAWKTFNVFHPEVEVNHKDGNTYNNTVSNLEWVTPSGNNKHAVETGLREDVVRCRVLDIVTQEIFEFSSMKRMTEFLFGPGKSLGKEFYKKSYPESLVKDRFEVKIGDDETEWFYAGKYHPVRPTKFVVTLKVNGVETERFYGQKELREKFKPKIGSVSIYKLCDVISSQIPGSEMTIEDRSPVFETEALNITTKQVISASSSAELSRKLGLLKSEVNKRVVHGLKTPLNGWLIRKKSDEDWFEPEEVANKPRCIEVFDTETGVTRTFNSIRETEKELKVFDRNTITLRISDGKPLGKYIVKSLLT